MANPLASTKPNRLLSEKSPYLLQHAHNPVDWYPWGEEAFTKAKAENKPILLSIGYSTCHWCHVMAHESFEDPQIASLMNQWFVCIKVDREELPDVDQVYMSAIMRLQGQGGWPLTAFLTPELKPFYGGTYFPPERRWQMPGMREILPSVADAWASRRKELSESAEQLTALLQQAEKAEPALPLNQAVLEAAFNHALAEFDAVNGGFGAAPKFPRSHELSFLLRYASCYDSPKALEMAESTLDHLARGGIHDHLGGGFHRYSTDAQWLVPHFEKMLYDQALLAKAYVEAYQLTGKAFYADVARSLFTYVLRDLRDPSGGFYSAEDADSEGIEGKFYVWAPEEILQVLGAEEGALFNAAYGVTERGNYEHGNILSLASPLSGDLSERLAEARAKLLKQRSRRTRPHRDEKILTSWNGLMIAALALGANALEDAELLQAAVRAAEFVLQSLSKDGILLRRFSRGEGRYPGSLEDYAFFSYGLLQLYQADYNPKWLGQAKRIIDDMIARFWDPESGGFFLRGLDEEPLIVQSKEYYDGATPSGNSVALCALQQLSKLLAEDAYAQRVRGALKFFSPRLCQTPWAAPQMLQALDGTIAPTQEIVIAESDSAGKTMLAQIRRRFLPRAVVLLHRHNAHDASTDELLPHLNQKLPIGGKSAVYWCENYSCQKPVTSTEALERLLSSTTSKSGVRHD